MDGSHKGRGRTEKTMKNDIEEKLRQKLANNGITEESDVVYLLVQARKLMEHDKALKTAHPTLDFYCNWGLHVELDRPAAQAFLTKVKPVLTLNLNCDQQKQNELDSLLTLDAFRFELRSLLSGFGADLSICDDRKSWTAFLRLYSEVVRDANLVLKGVAVPGGLLSLAVKTVTIQPAGGDPFTDATAKVYPMTWRITYADGRFGNLQLSEFGLLGATVDVFGPTLGSVNALARMQGIP
jgi:hypothetical protein